MNGFARFLATGAYSGYGPYVPGTWGTVPGVVLAPAFGALAAWSLPIYAIALLASVGVAIWAASVVVVQEQLSDPQIIVIDEIVGYLFTMAFLPVTGMTLFLAFVLFRIFDIIKPPPGRRLEHLHGGLGVVADDLWAGILGNLCLRALLMTGLF